MRDLQRRGVQHLVQQGAQVVEVLPRKEFEENHLPGAIHMPLGHLETEASEKLDKGVPVIVYCWDSA